MIEAKTAPFDEKESIVSSRQCTRSHVHHPCGQFKPIRIIQKFEKMAHKKDRDFKSFSGNSML